MAESFDVVKQDVDGPVATMTLSVAGAQSAQNSAMNCALDDAFHRAADDNEVTPSWQGGEHFSAGHDIGTPSRDIDNVFRPPASLGITSAKPGRRCRFTRHARPT